MTTEDTERGSPESVELLKPVELGFAEFVSQLISETLQAIVTSMIQQEKKIREVENLMTLDTDIFTERVINDEIVRNEILQIFPSKEEGKSSVDEGSPYVPENKEEGVKENPPIFSLINYKMSEGDFKKTDIGYTITTSGYKNICNHVKVLLSAQYKSAISNIIRRGFPRVLVDHGKINSKISISLRSETEKKEGNITIKPFLPVLRVQPINNRSPEFLGLNVNIVGEVEITFKTITI